MRSFIILGCVLCLFILTGCSKQTNTSTFQTLQTQSVLQKEINVGYISYAPGFIVDPNTQKMSGITHDILEEIAKRKNIKINYTTEVTRATLVETLNSEKVAMIASPVRITPEREANADFSVPLYYSPIGAYARVDDMRFDTLEKINNKSVKIVAVDGEWGQVIALTLYSWATLSSLPNTTDLSQLLLEVESNKADVTFVEPIFAYEYMQKNPGKLKNIAEKNPVKRRPNSFMFKQGNKELQALINDGIDELLKDGTLDKILNTYEPFPWAIWRVE